MIFIFALGRWFLTGHSGAGKSTLFKLICGIERPSDGAIWFVGHDISRLKNSEILFASSNRDDLPRSPFALWTERFMTMSLPLIIAGASEEDIRRRVSAALDKVGLLDKAKNYLSSFQEEQQRVGIAHAVVNKPTVLLADEPTGI